MVNLISDLRFALWLGKRNPTAPSRAREIAIHTWLGYPHLDLDALEYAIRAEICRDMQPVEVRFHYCSAGSWMERVWPI